MNFEGMPELGSKYGYFYVIGLPVTILIGLLLYIKKTSILGLEMINNLDGLFKGMII